MAYKLIITERAEEQLEQLIRYLIEHFKDKRAAVRLLDSIESVYERLEDNPMQFPACQDLVLKQRGYRKAKIPNMAYVMICRPETGSQKVYVIGIFHELENYGTKL